MIKDIIEIFPEIDTVAQKWHLSQEGILAPMHAYHYALAQLDYVAEQLVIEESHSSPIPYKARLPKDSPFPPLIQKLQSSDHPLGQGIELFCKARDNAIQKTASLAFTALTHLAQVPIDEEKYPQAAEYKLGITTARGEPRLNILNLVTIEDSFAEIAQLQNDPTLDAVMLDYAVEVVELARRLQNPDQWKKSPNSPSTLEDDLGWQSMIGFLDGVCRATGRRDKRTDEKLF